MTDIDNETIIKKAKKALPRIIKDYNQFQNSKKDYYKIASSIDFIKTPELPDDVMAPRQEYLESIFEAFDKEKILKFISEVISLSNSTVKNYEKAQYSKAEQFRNNHNKFVTDANKIIVYLEASIDEDGTLKYSADKPLKQKVYQPKEMYDFYKDIRNLIQDARDELFIADAYVDEDLLNLYVDKVNFNVNIRILTKVPSDNFITVAKKLVQKPKIKFEVRKIKDCHDRVIFIDDDCYVTGQSIKDAAKTKPTYIVKLVGKDIVNLFKQTHEDLWRKAAVLPLV